LKEGDKGREGKKEGGKGEAGFPLSREPNAGLDPRTLGSRPEPKADAQPTEPPRRSSKVIFNFGGCSIRFLCIS